MVLGASKGPRKRLKDRQSTPCIIQLPKCRAFSPTPLRVKHPQFLSWLSLGLTYHFVSAGSELAWQNPNLTVHLRTFVWPVRDLRVPFTGLCVGKPYFTEIEDLKIQVGTLEAKRAESLEDRTRLVKELKKRRVALESAFRNWHRSIVANIFQAWRRYVQTWVESKASVRGGGEGGALFTRRLNGCMDPHNKTGRVVFPIDIQD